MKKNNDKDIIINKIKYSHNNNNIKEILLNTQHKL